MTLIIMIQIGAWTSTRRKRHVFFKKPPHHASKHKVFLDDSASLSFHILGLQMHRLSRNPRIQVQLSAGLFAWKTAITLPVFLHCWH